MDDDKRLSYFFLGLGLGVAAGMLLAPKSGEETREFIKQKADEGADYLKRRSDDLRETASDYVDRGRSAFSRQRDNIAAAVDAGKAAYRDAVSSTGDSGGISTSSRPLSGGAEGI